MKSGESVRTAWRWLGGVFVHCNAGGGGVGGGSHGGGGGWLSEHSFYSEVSLLSLGSADSQWCS